MKHIEQMQEMFDDILLEKAKIKMNRKIQIVYENINKKIDRMLEYEKENILWKNVGATPSTFELFENNRIKPTGIEKYIVLDKTIKKLTPNNVFERVKFDIRKKKDDFDWMKKHFNFATQVKKNKISLVIFYKPRLSYVA